VIFDKQRETKLDKLEKEGGIIISPNKNSKYILAEIKAVKLIIFKNHDG